MLMNPESAKGLTQISYLLKLGATSPSIALGGGGGVVGGSSLVQGGDNGAVRDCNCFTIWAQSWKSG